MRTGGDAFFLKNVFINQELTVLGKVLLNDDLEVGNNAFINNKLTVNGNSKFHGSVKMTDLAQLNNLSNPNFEVMIKTPSGDVKTYQMSDLATWINTQPLDFIGCPSGNIDNPQWLNGVNKIFSPCDQVLIGLGTAFPAYKAHILGTVYSLKLKLGNIWCS